MKKGSRKKRDWNSFYIVCPNTGCWNWNRAIAGETGYGVVWYEGRLRGAHVVYYLRLVGPIPDGTELDHQCRNRQCVNPKHLEPVTHKVNMHRGAHCNKAVRDPLLNGKKLTDRQRVVLSTLPTEWVVVSCYHILRELVRRGFAERRKRHATGSRTYYEYRITELGQRRLDDRYPSRKDTIASRSVYSEDGMDCAA